jgi:uncharacterized protein
VTIAILALCAAVVNGAMGYGFSTLVVPVALLLYPSRVLNPGLVLAEIVLNLIALVTSRAGIPRVWRRVLPMMLAALPGIALGSVVLARAGADTLRFGTFIVLLPLVLLQAAGVRRPIRSEGLVSLPLGFGVGVLYACTTISGPPLALLFNNQGLSKDDFRSAMALFRLTESLATGIAYLHLSVYTPESVRLSAYILPCILIGVPIGRLVMGAIDQETFRRICMAFDALLISFGLCRLLVSKGWAGPHLPYALMALVAAADALILRAYFKKRPSS